MPVSDVVECWSGLTLINNPEPIKRISCPEVLPHIVDNIVGDGNCFSRAISWCLIVGLN